MVGTSGYLYAKVGTKKKKTNIVMYLILQTQKLTQNGIKT